MSLSAVAIRRPVFTTMVTVGLAVLGVLAFSRLQTDLYPDVKFPVVTVSVPYPGASPEDVEREVVKPIEEAVASVSGLDRIEAQAREGLGTVAVIFTLEADFDQAAIEVREKVAGMRWRLPEGAEEPIVQKLDIGATAIQVHAASSPRPPAEVREIVEDHIAPALERLAGVARVEVVGGAEREVVVDLDPVALEAFGLSPLDVVRVLRAENADVPAGSYIAAARETSVRTLAAFGRVEDVRDAILAAGPDGRRVRVGDVATVRESSDAETLIRANAADAVAFQIIKTPGANTIEVCHAVTAELARLAPTLPAGFETRPLIDQSSYIEANAEEVEVALVFGGAMAILVILLFMGDVRSVLISALALPTSVLGTFLLMWALGFSLNMMTLLGLALAIGLLIDDAVVVRESIFRRLERGEAPAEAAARGTAEIALAVLATTLTIVAVFVPVAFMDGIVGQFFRQFGLTVAAAVLLSMVVAFTLDPMLSARFARGRDSGGGAFKRGVDRVFAVAARGYRRVLGWAVDHRKTVALLAVVSFVLGMAIAARIGGDFLAPEDRGQFILDLELEPGTSLEATSATSLEIERQLIADPRFRTVYATIGVDGDAHKARYRVDVGPKESRDASLAELQQVARSIAARTPDARVFVSNVPMIEGGKISRPLELAVSGPDYAVLEPTAERIADVLRGLPGTSDVRIDHERPRPELRVLVDRERAARQGVPAAVIGMTVRAALDGVVAGRLRAPGSRGEDDEIDIRVRLAEADRSDPAAIARLPLPGRDGLVRLGEIAELEPGVGPTLIDRGDRSRRILVSAVVTGRPLGAVVADVDRQLPGLVPAGYTTTWRGFVRDMEDSNAAFGLALAIAMLFVYIVLASQFESFVQPLTIMLSLPLAFVGAFVALWLMGASVTLGAQIGLILLMGLVTKNAILLVDRALIAQREGLPAREAMLAAGAARLRPILMTSAAMVLGMLPTAVGEGTGSEFRAPMAVAVIGGIVSSTLLTLVVVPVVFLAVESTRARLDRLRASWRKEVPR